jgi:hypothetical protein
VDQDGPSLEACTDVYLLVRPQSRGNNLANKEPPA